MVHQDINLADTYQGKPPVTLLGGASLNNDDFVRRGQRYVRGALFVDAFFRSSPDPTTADFVARFNGAYERDPGLLEALAYDTTRALLTRIGDGATNRPGLRRALAAYEPVATVTGETGFDPDGDMLRDLLLLTVQEDGIVQLYPVPPPADLLAPIDAGAPIDEGAPVDEVAPIE